MSETPASREMTAEELVAAAEKLDVVDGAIAIPALWPRLILERAARTQPEQPVQTAGLTAEEAFERGRDTGTVEGWADYTNAAIEPCHPACRMCSGAHDPRCVLDDGHQEMCHDAFGHALTVLVPVEPDYFTRLRAALAQAGPP